MYNNNKSTNSNKANAYEDNNSKCIVCACVRVCGGRRSFCSVCLYIIQVSVDSVYLLG